MLMSYNGLFWVATVDNVICAGCVTKGLRNFCRRLGWVRSYLSGIDRDLVWMVLMPFRVVSIGVAPADRAGVTQPWPRPLLSIPPANWYANRYWWSSFIDLVLAALVLNQDSIGSSAFYRFAFSFSPADAVVYIRFTEFYLVFPLLRVLLGLLTLLMASTGLQRVLPGF